MTAPVSRIIPADEKTTPARLYNAEGYRQVVALRFKMGDIVRIPRLNTTLPFYIAACSATDKGVTYNLGLDGRVMGNVWRDSDLELVEPAP